MKRNATQAVALVRDECGQLVRTPLKSTCGISARIWNSLADRILADADGGKYYPLDPLDVYQGVALKLITAANGMPELETAAPDTYLFNAIKFAFFDVWKEVKAERENQLAAGFRGADGEEPDSDDALPSDDDGAPKSVQVQTFASLPHADVPQGDHNYAPLYKAIAALKPISRRMYRAACAYLDPQVDGNLLACAAAAGVRKSRFYARFWPKTLATLRRLLEGNETV